MEAYPLVTLCIKRDKPRLSLLQYFLKAPEEEGFLEPHVMSR